MSSAKRLGVCALTRPVQTTPAAYSKALKTQRLRTWPRALNLLWSGVCPVAMAKFMLLKNVLIR
jgi:hypothetical protein